MDGKLNSKVNNNEAGADSLLSKLTTSWTATPTDNTYFIRQDTGGGDSFGRVKFSTLWNYIKGKADGIYQPKGSYAASGHVHDDRYYTENEMNTKLSAKAENIVLAYNANLDNVTTPGFYSCGVGNSISNKPTGTDAIGLIVTHNASGDYYTQILTTSSNANTYRRTCLNGTWSGWTQDKYTDTNTWRGIQNNLTSDSTSDSLSAAQGKALKGLVDSKASSDHTHGLNSSSLTKSVDNATTNSWNMVGGNKNFLLRSLRMQAKAPDWLEDNYAAGIAFGGEDTKGVISHAYNAPDIKFAGGNGAAPVWWLRLTGTSGKTYNLNAMPPASHTHTKDQVGLGNVDNTSDASKSVKYAANAGNANTATKATTADNATTAKSLQLLSSTRPTSMNFNLSSADYNQKVTYAIASANTKEGKPPRDSLVTTYAWDNSGWGAQLAIDSDSNPRMYVRGATNNNGASKWDANWKTVAFTDDKPATAGTADKANSVDWSNVQNKPSSYPPASHTHAYLPTGGGTMSGALNFANGIWNHVGDDVQIGDHNTSGSFYVQGLNGPTNIKLKKKGDTSTGSGDSATITYDGGNLIIDKTIQANLSGNASTATKAVSADKATSASSADKAAKLTTARTVSGGSDITLDFKYDGSGNSTANIGFYSCKHGVSNTNNYPFHRFAKLDANKNAWVDNSMTFLISQDYSGGGYGICRLVYRSNADSGSASVDAQWLVRRGFSADTIQVAIKIDKTNGTYCDAFYKSSGTYNGVVIRAIASGGSATSGRTWTLINSNETDGTTATDKKTSSECWKTIADAGNELHKQAYSSSAPAIDGGYVASAGLANTAASCTGNSASATKLTSSAGSATQPVYFKDGKPVAGTYTLGDASSKMVRTLSAQGNSGWANQTTDDKYVPTMSFMAYWNGAYGGTASNLQYCDRGRFGTIVTKNSGDYAAASHTHNYAGSGSAGGSANSAIKLDSSAGSAIQPVYFKDGKPVATTYTLNKTVPADAKFTDTNTWRGIQNNLTSDSTDQSLSAAQGKALKTLVDGKAPASHKHTKSQITDFPTSMPASDVSAWAKAATKPSYTKAEVGLSNVDNTADKDKSVKYAASAGSASQLNGFTIQASTSDLTAGYSRLNNNVIYIVYE